MTIPGLVRGSSKEGGVNIFDYYGVDLCLGLSP